MTKAELDEVAMRIFRVLARAEYALKAADFAFGGNEVMATPSRP